MKKIIGILGFGLVGRSYTDYYIKRRDELIHVLFDKADLDTNLVVWDQKSLGADDRTFLNQHGIIALDATIATMREFVASCDAVLLSPGVNVYRLPEQHKFFAELDIFSTFFNGKSVAITGSLGKSTVTSLTAQVLSLVCAATVPAIGNIGDPLLYSLYDQPQLAVLELSSFQLERNRSFIPDVALLTNLYPNHLDRHTTMHHYFAAKWHLFTQQRPDQITILPWQLFTGTLADQAQKALAQLRSQVILITDQQIDTLSLSLIKRDQFNVIGLRGDIITRAHIIHGAIMQEQELLKLSALPDVTFTENLLMIVGLLYGSGIAPATLQSLSITKPAMLDHRLECFTSVNGITFYNDSKSTVIQSTAAAADKLATTNKPLIIILGGLGKGVDRSALVKQLQQTPHLKKIYCFGPECSSFGLTATHNTLSEVIDDLFQTIAPGDQVLFSPGGTSYDAFKNYAHRGDVFKELVLQKVAQLNS